MSAAVETRDLFRVHRTPEGDAAALQGLTLRVESGEVLAILGPSGSGKSSLLRVLAGLDTPSAGQALVLGHDVARIGARRRGALRQTALGLVDQHYDRALPAVLPCLDVVALPLTLRGVPPAAARRRAAELLERVGLADRAAARPGELSGGEQQRVALCAAIAHRPRLLLADEPAGELEAASAATVYRLIAELARAERATAVVVTHDPSVRARADRTVRLRDGRIAGEAGGSGDEAMVVGRGGWLHLPDDLLRAAGLGDRLHARAEPGRIILEPAQGGLTPMITQDPAGDQKGQTPMITEAAADDQRGLTPMITEDPASDQKGQTPLIAAELRAVDKAYGEGSAARRVLAGFSASFPAGRLTALTGRSGSGKSTVLRLLAGLELPDAGEVLAGGVAVHELDRDSRARLRRDRIAVVPQESGLVGHLSAEENVALALELRGVRGAEARDRAAHWLTDVGLVERIRQRVHRLSAGERQRVALARALATGAPVLLVDEPTSRLDEANAGAVAGLLAEAARRHGVAVVCATHDPVVVAAADAVVPMPEASAARAGEQPQVVRQRVDGEV